ncbi:MAG TPA: immunoglobulin domain-containing protein [Telluria sp.]|nr:immunoglobulin domain-containing protein [Telluria sp.]
MSDNKVFRWRSWLIPLFFISMLVAGCGDDDNGNDAAPMVAPTIATQPANATVAEGATATFTVTANGTAPLAYQWRRNGANISGANTASYTTPPVTAADSGARYSVTVSNDAGTAVSNDAVLTLSAVTPVAPSITTQPAATTVSAGQSATFSVAASGTPPLAYQWRRNGINIAGATGASYTVPATLATDNGTRYSVTVSNATGQVTSNEALLTVTAAAVAPTITQQPASTTVNPGQTATFSVGAGGTAPLSYQWMRGGVAISGATAASYTTPAVTAGDNGSVFTVVVSNAAGSATSNAATLTVMSVAVAPTITRQPVDATTYEGFTASFSVEASGTAPLTYQWRRNGVDIAGATSPNYVTPVLSQANGGDRYQVVVSNSAGSVTSNEARVTVLAY